VFEVSQMNKTLIKALCLSFLAGISFSLVRAEEVSSSASVAPGAPMSVTVAPTAGAVVIEASTNLVDWADVTMLFPDGGSGLFIDTQSTNLPSASFGSRSSFQRPTMTSPFARLGIFG